MSRQLPAAARAWYGCYGSTAAARGGMVRLQKWGGVDVRPPPRRAAFQVVGTKRQILTTRETINDPARAILHDNGRPRLLRLATSSEIINHLACCFDGGSVTSQLRSLKVPDFDAICINHIEEIARHAPTFGVLYSYRKRTPSFEAVRQITLQLWGDRPGMPSRNIEGISKVAGTSRLAPDSEKLRTVHGRCAFFPRIIVPVLNVRLRVTFRRLVIGFRNQTERSNKGRQATLLVRPQTAQTPPAADFPTATAWNTHIKATWPQPQI